MMSDAVNYAVLKKWLRDALGWVSQSSNNCSNIA